MKKIFFLMSSLLLSIGLYAQGPIMDKFKHELLTEDDQFRNSRNEGDLRDSFITWEWNEFDQSWVYFTQDKLYHDENGRTINDVNYNWIDPSWLLNYQSSYAYNSDGFRISIVDQDWTGATWENVDSVTYERDANGNATLILSRNWNGASWDNNTKTEYTYTSDNQKITVLSQKWDIDHWLNITLLTNTFENNKVKIALNQTWDTLSGWVNTYQNLYTYGSNGLPKVVVYQSWEDPDWQNVIRTNYEYDGSGNIALTLREKYVGSNMWENVYQLIDDYDSFGNFKSELYQTWTNNNWKNNSYYHQAYDDRHNLLSAVTQYWSDAWVNSDSTQFYYTLSSGLADGPPASNLTIYPNPASSFLIVDEPGNWAIYSNTGMVVMKSNYKDQNPQLIDVSKLIPGVYSLVMRRENGTSAEQFLKL